MTATAATKDYPVERLGNPGDGHGPVRHNGRLYVSGMVGIVDTDGELLVRIPPLSHPPPTTAAARHSSAGAGSSLHARPTYRRDCLRYLLATSFSDP